MTCIKDGLESVLGFNVGEIDRRKKDLGMIGKEELEIRLKEYKGQPWDFLLYMAFNYPEQFTRITQTYHGYDGALNYKVLTEKIKNYHVMSTLLSEITEAER